MPVSKEVVEEMLKRAGKDISTDTAQALMEDMMEKGSVAEAHALLDSQKAFLKKTFMHSLEDSSKSGLGFVAKIPFSWKGITAVAGTAGTLAVQYLMTKGILGVHNAQDPTECHDKCLTGKNTDQTQYAIDSKTPDPNCPSGTTDCESYCSTDDPGACSRKNNLARGKSKCSGLAMAECVGTAAGDAFDSADKFWETFGTSLTYLGYGLAVFLMCIFVYYTVKSFAVTKVGNVVTKAKSAGESFGGKKVPAPAGP